MKALHPLFLAPTIVLACTAGTTAQGETDRLLSAELERLSAELAAKNPLPLPDLPANAAIPSSVRDAGPEFVEAWSLWLRVNGTEIPAVKKGDTPPINAGTEPPLFQDLLNRTIKGDPPVDPAEYTRFIYSDASFCGDGVSTFLMRYSAGLALAQLRKGDHPAAIRTLAKSSSPAFDKVLTAFRADPETYAIGKWLHRKAIPEDLVRKGGDKTAAMLLKWTRIHAPSEILRRKTRGAQPEDEPYFPDRSLISFLGDRSKASDEMKASIGSFIGTDGLKLRSVDEWIDQQPRDSGKWLVQLAKAGLESPSNVTRRTSSRILTDAGIDHADPPYREDPLFRVLVNGEARPGLSPLMTIYGSRSSYSMPRLYPADDGLLTMKGDDFFKDGGAAHVTVTSGPALGGETASPDEPWLSATIPNVPKFDTVNEIRFETMPVTIEASFPWKGGPEEQESAWVDFSRQTARPPEQPDHCSYPLGDSGSLVIKQVSVGTYWFRVRHPAAAHMPWTKISVSKDDHRFTAKVDRGTTLVVPVRWPDEDMQQEKGIPIPLKVQLDDPRYGGSMLGRVRVFKDGAEYHEADPIVPEASDKFPDSAVFKGLPPGSYEIRFVGLIPPEDFGGDYPGYKPASIQFTVPEKPGPLMKTGELVVQRETK